MTSENLKKQLEHLWPHELIDFGIPAKYASGFKIDWKRETKCKDAKGNFVRTFVTKNKEFPQVRMFCMTGKDDLMGGFCGKLPVGIHAAD